MNAYAGSGLWRAVRAAGPPLLFGLRLWTSVCLALYVAFWLELDTAYWAGTSAALMCQPHLGASLRKGWFRMIGTVVGAVAIVLLTAWFPQNRGGFLLGLTIWCAVCAFAGTMLRNFAGYAAALAGFTAVIIASDELGAVGGTNGEAFTFAIARVTEIWIGIACAGIVLASSDLGTAPRRLVTLFADLSAEIGRRFGATFASLRPIADTQVLRRELVREVVALDLVIDEAIGESSRLRYHSNVLQQGVRGLFAALAGCRAVAVRLAALSGSAPQHDAKAVLDQIPQQLGSILWHGKPSRWRDNPIGMRRLCETAARELIALPAATPSLRLLADETARVLTGLSQVLDALALLVAEPDRHRSRSRIPLHVADWLPALVNAGRACVSIGAIELFWVATGWPSGATAISWTSIAVLLFAQRADEAYARTMSFMVGTGLATICAAIMLFAALPHVETFVSFSILMGLYLVPIGALMAQPWQAAVFAPMAGNFVPLLAPANQMTYDTVQFYNSALAIVVGSGVAALSFRLLPPLSPAFRTRRLVALTLRDLRWLARTTKPQAPDWEARVYNRLAALPDKAEPLQRAQLMTALTVGTEVIHLRGIAPQLSVGTELDSALGALAQGESAFANAKLAALDEHLAMTNETGSQKCLVMRARGQILVIRDALARHQKYFDSRQRFLLGLSIGRGVTF